MDKDSNKNCAICGHNFDDHLIKGYGEMPLEGWMECPVENCKCEMTWSLEEKARSEMEKYKSEKGIE